MQGVPPLPLALRPVAEARTAHPVLGVCNLLPDVLEVLVHDSDPASIFFQLQVHHLQLLLQGLWQAGKRARQQQGSWHTSKAACSKNSCIPSRGPLHLYVCIQRPVFGICKGWEEGRLLPSITLHLHLACATVDQVQASIGVQLWCSSSSSMFNHCWFNLLSISCSYWTSSSAMAAAAADEFSVQLQSAQRSLIAAEWEAERFGMKIEHEYRFGDETC